MPRSKDRKSTCCHQKKDRFWSFQLKMDFHQLHTLISRTFNHHVSAYIFILGISMKHTLWNFFVIDFHLLKNFIDSENLISFLGKNKLTRQDNGSKSFWLIHGKIWTVVKYVISYILMHIHTSNNIINKVFSNQ